MSSPVQNKKKDFVKSRAAAQGCKVQENVSTEFPWARPQLADGEEIRYAPTGRSRAGCVVGWRPVSFTCALGHPIQMRLCEMCGAKVEEKPIKREDLCFGKARVTFSHSYPEKKDSLTYTLRAWAWPAPRCDATCLVFLRLLHKNKVSELIAR